MKNILKEPLLHFLLAGALIFLIYDMTSTSSPEDENIVFSQSELQEILDKYHKQFKRNPTYDELISQVENRIREEIFYREALKMKLDHNDEVIKRRMAQKMQYLAGDLANLTDATEDELLEFYNENSDMFMEPARYSLHQIYFNKRNSEELDPVITERILMSNFESINNIKKLSDDLSVPDFFDLKYLYFFERQFGKEFANSLEGLEIKKWAGPVASGLGLHFVFIEEKLEESLAEYDSVRDKVLKEFNYNREKEFKEMVYKELRNQYTVDFNLDEKGLPSEIIEKLKSEI